MTEDTYLDTKENGAGNMERVVDPDDYNLRRRFKQLHDAKENVKEVKNKTVHEEWRTNPTIRADTKEQREVVAEALVDYMCEIRPLLSKIGQEEKFLNDQVDVDGESVTFGEIIENRGYVANGVIMSRVASMAAWDTCNTYFEDLAGAFFEEKVPEPGANPVDPAGRIR